MLDDCTDTTDDDNDGWGTIELGLMNTGWLA